MKTHCVKVSITNCFLLECDEGYLLIDTCYPNKYGTFKKRLGGLGIGLSDIKYLLLTHHHVDHTGFAGELIEDTGARVIAHRDGLPFLARGGHDKNFKLLSPCVAVLTGLFYIFRSLKYPPFELTGRDILLDGDDPELLRRIGIDGTILYTPGHTVDSISVVLPNGDAFVGDVAMNTLNVCRTKRRPIVAADRNRVFESWKRLVEHGARRIYPSHGKPFPVEDLTSYLEKLGIE